MKAKITRAAFKGINVVKIGYCGAQNILRHFDPIYYGSGVYGWNYDIYVIDGVVISTGYRPIGNVEPSYEILRHLESRMQYVDNLADASYEKREEMRAEVVKDFIIHLKTAKPKK